MTITQHQLNDYLQDYLQVVDFQDYCPNGLQVQGNESISHIVTGVTACQALIDAAIAENADALLVHHGYFWRGEETTLTSYKRQRIASLLEHDINLFAYHLPLDAHNKVGNNVQLAKLLGMKLLGNQNLLFYGSVEQQSGEQFASLLTEKLQRQPLWIEADRAITKIAWCTGAAQDMLEQAAAMGVDAYMSGEISERTYHQAKELGIHYFAAGHHATERYGVKALGEHLAKQFSVSVRFIDINNPV